MSLGKNLGRGMMGLYNKIEDGEMKWPFPLIDVNKIDAGKIKDKVYSAEFLGEPLYYYLEMRKKGN